MIEPDPRSHMYAIGGNPEAARLAGVRVQRLRATGFALVGAAAAIAGILINSSAGAANPNTGVGLLLPAYAAAFLGSSMTERQALYVAAIGLGALSFVAAARAVRAAPPRARVLVVLGLASALAVGAACFPDQLARGAVPEGTLMQFRFGSLVGQLFFWIGLTTAGCLLLRQRRSATTA